MVGAAFLSDQGADLVQMLAVPYRAAAACRSLLRLGSRVLPAVRCGLRHSSVDVRFHCCRFLDRHLQPDLIEMLDDIGERVRVTTLHTLACDRCKEGSCRPKEAEVLPRAMEVLAGDPSAHVRGRRRDGTLRKGPSTGSPRQRNTGSHRAKRPALATGVLRAGSSGRASEATIQHRAPAKLESYASFSAIKRRTLVGPRPSSRSSVGSTVANSPFRLAA